MIDWSQLIIQLIGMLIPVAIAMVNQNRKITRLMIENEDLRNKIKELTQYFTQLQADHTSLQEKYELSLRSQAGLRDRF